MDKLVKAYCAWPTMANRARLEKYLKAYPMAVCLADAETIALLRSLDFRV